MNIHYLKHVPFEGLGSMEGQLVEQGHHITLTNLYLGERLPSPESIDALIIMGGPMGVRDEKDYPWLEDEKHFIGEVIHQYTPVLGICLGAQLIADVLGARVTRNAHREISSGLRPFSRFRGRLRAAGPSLRSRPSRPSTRPRGGGPP